MKTAVVLGAGGFIGSHMVKRLKSEGYWVRGVDIKHPEFSTTGADEFILHDLSKQICIPQCLTVNYGQPFTTPEFFDEVYQFAADMGGAGYVFTGNNDANILSNSVLINLNVAGFLKGTKSQIFYSSSACMYPQEIQESTQAVKLKESDAYPANPDSDYGWEKLFSERIYMAFARNFNLNVRIGRFHNIYGPEGTWSGGKEKAPAAICRKVIQATSAVEIWGTGEQTRSFLYIDDCIDAVRLLMKSDYREPVNIGSEETISINNLAVMAMDVEKNYLDIYHSPDAPIGVMGRSSDNTVIEKELGWKPKFSLTQGITITYKWIKRQINANKL